MKRMIGTIILLYVALLALLVAAFSFGMGFLLFLASGRMVLLFAIGEEPFFYEPIVLMTICILTTAVIFIGFRFMIGKVRAEFV